MRHDCDSFRGWDRACGIHRKHVVAIWAFILVYKFQDERITHVGNIDRSGFFRRLLGR